MLGIGKIDFDLLNEIVSRNSGARRDDVIIGPSIGEDAAIIRVGDTEYVIVAHTDPVTEAYSNLGWLAVNVAANDIAVSGAEPSWLLMTILLPPGSSLERLESILKEAGEAAGRIGASIVGGHTEVSPGITKPIVIVTAIGLAYIDSYTPTRNARPGDVVFQVKPAALEGTAIIAHDFKDKLILKGVEENLIYRAERFIEEISVVQPALLLARERLVNSMHDPTEGGILGGLIEVARSSGTSLLIDTRKILVRPETLEICNALNVDWLRLISSGSIIGTMPPSKTERAAKLLEHNGFGFSVIGKVVDKRGFDVRLTDKNEEYSGFIEDEISSLFK